MERKDIVCQLKEIIIKSMSLTCEPEELKGEDLIGELGINSVDALEILVWVENTFNIQIEDEELNSDILTSLDVLANYITSKQSSSN